MSRSFIALFNNYFDSCKREQMKDRSSHQGSADMKEDTPIWRPCPWVRGIEKKKKDGKSVKEQTLTQTFRDLRKKKPKLFLFMLVLANFRTENCNQR